MENLIPFVPLLPLLGFVITGLLGNRLPQAAAGWIATLAVLGSFAVTLALLGNVSPDHSLSTESYTWLAVGEFRVGFGFLVDSLSIWMMLIVTGIGALIHIYSIGYMHHEDRRGFSRFFAYLNLFIFSMLLLVMGDSYVMMFFGWEGVGLCSYLLIGFWYKNLDYGKAARKAFIMNRIGDLGFLLAVFFIAAYLGNGTTSFAAVAEGVGAASPAMLTTIALLLFVGAMGKSAQIPLYTWLPDAMAGPTPVSALIHAATMVTAGIYLIARSHFIYDLAPIAQQTVLIVGLLTSVFAAIIGLRQNDIKKVLAYSTVSQLGLMFVALGVGAYSSAMFHVSTHAFFKALLFLGAGSVIHALHDEQDLRNMGGLRKKLPLTFAVMLIGTLSIIGLPPFSGFFSKDEILAKTFEASPVLWALTLGSSILTGLYMLRMLLVAFWGKYRGKNESHIHESPAIMTAPLVVLAILSVLGGLLNLPHLLGENGTQWLAHWLNISTAGHVEGEVTHAHLSAATEWALIAVAVLAVVVVLFITRHLYIAKALVPNADESMGAAEKTIARKFYVDELYDAAIVNPIARLGQWLHRIPELKIIDGAVNGLGKMAMWLSSKFRLLQNGNVEYYLFGMVIGAVCLAVLSLLL